MKFPNNLTVIESGTFTDCTGLTKIELPSSLQGFLNTTFRNCSNIDTVILDDNNQNFKCIDNIVYSKDLKKLVYVPLGLKGAVSIAEGVQAIDHKTFKDCANITSITLPESVIRIQNDAFQGCNSLETVNIPQNIDDMTMVEGMFIGCKKLQKINIENKDLKIKSHWFGRKGTSKIAADIDYDIIKQVCTSFYPSQLAKDLKDLILPSVANKLVNEKEIEKEWKEDWIKYIKSKRKSLYTEMVENEDLLTVVLNEKLLSLSELKDVINTSQSSSKVDVTARLMEYENNNFSQKDLDKNIEKGLKVPVSVQSPSELKKSWSVKKREDGTLIITGYKGSDNVVVVPSVIGKDKVSAIGPYAFNPMAKRLTNEQKTQRENITSITINEGITCIEDRAFWNCSSLTTLTLPEGLETLKGYILEDSFSSKLYGFVYGCNNLTSLCIPSTVKNIEDGAFDNCSSLEKIEVHDNNNYYCSIDGILYDKDVKTCVFVPDGIKGDITICEGVTKIKDKAFNSCKYITSIKFQIVY